MIETLDTYVKDRCYGMLVVEDGQQYEVQVSWDKEIVNFVTYENQARGVYLSVKPVKVTYPSGIRCVTYGAFEGTRVLLEEANRFSAPRLRDHAELQLDTNGEWFKKLLARVKEIADEKRVH